MKKILLLLSLQFLLIFVGCKNEIDVQLSGPLPEAGQVGGRIILPANTKLDTTGLEVLTAVGSVTPVNARYAIDTTGKTSTTLLMNKAGDVVLMGYNYPGQSENNISTESTALALLMNTLTLRSLSESGKLEVVRRIKADSNYKTLVNEISGSLSAGKAVTDTTNKKLISAISSLFNSSTNLRVSATTSYSKPVEIKTANTTILLQNSNVAHTYVAGLYKGGNPVGGKYVIGGRTIFATSLSEAAAGVFGDGYGIPSPVLITLEGDGKYQLRIRSGKPGTDDGSDESRMARARNVYGFMAKILNEIMPLGKDCGEAFAKGVPRLLSTIVDKKEAALNSAGSSAVFASIALDITGEALTNAEELLESCSGDLDMFTYLKGIGRTFTLIGYATKFMTGANITAHTNDLFQARSSIDTCFQVKGLKMYKCGEDLNYLIQIVSGNTQKGEFGKSLISSLVVKVTDKAGKVIEKADVTWTINTGEGSLSAEKSVTNAQGLAEVKWTLGTKAATQQVTASVNEDEEIKTVAFSATAIPGIPTKVEIVSGNNQAAAAGKALSNPLVIKVTDQYGHPVPKVEVDWQIKSGGGSFMYSNRLTGEEGTASANWILGQSGTQTVDVVVKNKDANYVAGAPLRFEAKIGDGTLAKLILGTWREVRSYGLEGNKPYENINDGRNQYYYIFNNDGTVVSKDFEEEKWYTRNYLYQIDENKKTLFTMDPTDPERDDDGGYFDDNIIILNEHKMLLFNEGIYEGVRYSSYFELERIAKIPNLRIVNSANQRVAPSANSEIRSKRSPLYQRGK
ncbi:Ig-like domain-containing protein [Dyadobacter psychrotolerans]|nr:Ig-like domain-containing protein [Dyadobacter psychrotolerans]